MNAVIEGCYSDTGWQPDGKGEVRRQLVWLGEAISTVTRELLTLRYHVTDLEPAGFLEDVAACLQKDLEMRRNLDVLVKALDEGIAWLPAHPVRERLSRGLKAMMGEWVQKGGYPTNWDRVLDAVLEHAFDEADRYARLQAEPDPPHGMKIRVLPVPRPTRNAFHFIPPA